MLTLFMYVLSLFFIFFIFFIIYVIYYIYIHKFRKVPELNLQWIYISKLRTLKVRKKKKSL